MIDLFTKEQEQQLLKKEAYEVWLSIALIPDDFAYFDYASTKNSFFVASKKKDMLFCFLGHKDISKLVDVNVRRIITRVDFNNCFYNLCSFCSGLLSLSQWNRKHTSLSKKVANFEAYLNESLSSSYENRPRPPFSSPVFNSVARVLTKYEKCANIILYDKDFVVFYNLFDVFKYFNYKTN